MNMPHYTIAVTGLNATDNPGPGIPVIRSLKEAKSFSCDIIGLSYENMEPGIFLSSLVERCYQIPYPACGSEALLERIKYINQQKKIDIIIPNFDAELLSFIQIEPLLNELNIKMCLPSSVQIEARQKDKLAVLGKSLSINIPETTSISSSSEINSINLQYPFWVKGALYEAYLSHNFSETSSAFYKIYGKWGAPVLLQQHIPGQQYNITACGDGKGNTIACVAMRKLYITNMGKAWAGISVKNEILTQICHDFISATKWKGGLEFEIIKKEDEDKFYVIEINPRLPAWVYLATSVGQNIPEQMVHIANCTEPKVYDDYSAGKMFIRYSWDLIIDHSVVENYAVTGEKA